MQRVADLAAHVLDHEAYGDVVGHYQPPDAAVVVAQQQRGPVSAGVGDLHADCQDWIPGSRPARDEAVGFDVDQDADRYGAVRFAAGEVVADVLEDG